MHLLLVEDNDGHALLLTTALERCADVTWHRVERGAEALSYLAQHLPRTEADPVDLVLLDLKLPGMSGLEVLAAIKSDPRTSRLPVCVLSTSSAQKDREQAYAGRANAYLVKPADFSGFCQLAEALTAFWGRWNCRA